MPSLGERGAQRRRERALRLQLLARRRPLRPQPRHLRHYPRCCGRAGRGGAVQSHRELRQRPAGSGLNRYLGVGARLRVNAHGAHPCALGQRGRRPAGAGQKHHVAGAQVLGERTVRRIDGAEAQRVAVREHPLGGYRRGDRGLQALRQGAQRRRRPRPRDTDAGNDGRARRPRQQLRGALKGIRGRVRRGGDHRFVRCSGAVRARVSCARGAARHDFAARAGTGPGHRLTGRQHRVAHAEVDRPRAPGMRLGHRPAHQGGQSGGTRHPRPPLHDTRQRRRHRALRVVVADHHHRRRRGMGGLQPGRRVAQPYSGQHDHRHRPPRHPPVAVGQVGGRLLAAAGDVADVVAPVKRVHRLVLGPRPVPRTRDSRLPAPRLPPAPRRRSCPVVHRCSPCDDGTHHESRRDQVPTGAQRHLPRQPQHRAPAGRRAAGHPRLLRSRLPAQPRGGTGASPASTGRRTTARAGATSPTS